MLYFLLIGVDCRKVEDGGIVVKEDGQCEVVQLVIVSVYRAIIVGVFWCTKK